MNEISQPARARLLFLSLVRLIVEKHGGHLDIDIEKDTFKMFVPQERRLDCFHELESTVGPLEHLHESVLPIQ
jgi:hypothetical protein